ncbi:hypothetical protein, partial [Lapillicoccus sp.]|uniref:hypothetical protein n=1 Tax=Lapillicoccus sp. TaxID=1909287 RepID=UPI0025D855C4
VYKGDFVTPTNVTIATFSSGSAKTFVSTKTPASTVVGSDGAVVETVPADSSNYSFFLTWTSNQWKIAEIQGVA